VRIGCLHTAESNIAVFDAAVQALGPERPILQHEVRADLLGAAERARGLTSDIADRTRLALAALCEGNDVVLLTCSTLGPAVEGTESAIPIPILRIDASLANQAVRRGGKVVALCAVESTLAPTTRLFHEAARVTGAAIDVRLVPGAWAMFQAGDMNGYWATIARAADRAYVDGAVVVAMAQASMAPASALVTQGPPPLNSVATGLFAARVSCSPVFQAYGARTIASHLPQRSASGSTSAASSRSPARVAR
jgi:hypothetical protein